MIFRKNIVGMKDPTGNLWNNFKAENFSMFVGSEKKLLENLKIGGSWMYFSYNKFTQGLFAKKSF